MKFTNLRIGVRLGLAFALVLTLTFLMTLVGITRLQAVADAANTMEEATYKERLSQEWLRGIVANSVRTFARAKSTDPQDQKYFQVEMDAQSEVLTKVQKELEGLIKNADAKRLVAVVGERRKEYVDIRKSVFKFKEGMKAGDEAELKNQVDTKLLPAMNAYSQSVRDVVDFQKRIFEQSKAEVDSLHRSGKNLLIGLGIAALVIGALLAWLLARSISRPLTYAVSVARTVASGNLSSTIHAHGGDETGQLLQELTEMTGQLRHVVGEVQQGTRSIASAASEIATGNLDLSSRTELQASSLEQTASAMEQLTSTVKQNADNARQANNLVLNASEVARKGGAVVAEVVTTMGSINESSRKIVDIIAVIDGIAFQTNILALNAAVEAARAGEQGRGFAVVAAEVRMLAQRSAAAAKEIKQLIDASVDKVEIGAKLVDKAGSTMNEIVESVRQVTTIMAEITVASVEQTSGIEEINLAITQMDEVTQQNAALVEQAAAAAQSLLDQAATLSQVVGRFDTGVPEIAAPALPRSAMRSSALATQRLGRSTHKATQNAAQSAADRPARKRPAQTNSNNDWEEF